MTPDSAASPQDELAEPDEIVSEPQVRVSSYATLVNPNKGSALKFIPAQTINVVQCAKITCEDVEPEITYWLTSVICSVLGANPPLEVIEGYFRKIWKSLDIDKINLVRNGLFLVRLNNLDDHKLVVQKGAYYFDRKPLLVKPWNPEFDLQTESLTSLPIWVHLHDLDLKYWGMDSLRNIGSTLGIPLKTDKYTMEKRVLKYARRLIDIQVDASFPDHVHFVNDQDVVVRISS